MEMKENLYCVQDTVSGNLSHFVLATSDGLACRNILLTMEVPLKDTKVFRLATVTRTLDDSHCDFSVDYLDEPVFVSWDSYRFPNDVAEALAPLGLSHDEVVEISKNRIKETING